MNTNLKTLIMLLMWLTLIVLGCCYVRIDWMAAFTQLRASQHPYVTDYGRAPHGRIKDGPRKQLLSSSAEQREPAGLVNQRQPELESQLWPAISEEVDGRRKRELPQVIIAGVKKCGTGALQTFLEIHTDIVIASGEQHFFERDDNYYQGLEWYRQKMPASSPGQLTLEKTPKYFVTEKAVRRIHEMNSSIRILFIVREPTFRMVSDYLHQRHYHPLFRPESTFEQLAINSTTGDLNEASEELRTSIYHVHFRKWLKYFSRSQILVVDGEAFAHNPVPELVKVERFLGLEHQFNGSTFTWNIQRGVHCIRRDEEGTECLGKEKGRPHPRVDQNVWDQLCQYFKPHNQIFFAMIGERFKWTCSQRAAIF